MQAALRSLGAATSRVPTGASRSRWRRPLRELTRSGVRSPNPTPQAASAWGESRGVDERGEQVAHQIRVRLGQLLVEKRGGSILGPAVIAVGPSSSRFSQITRRIHPVAAPTLEAPAHPGPSYTPLRDSTARPPVVAEALHLRQVSPNGTPRSTTRLRRSCSM